jgi:integrase/recombinase XerD
MTKYNIKNERIKKDYYDYLKESKGRNDKTLDQVRNSLYRFEIYTKFKDFITFNKEQAKGFKKHLAKQKTQRTGEAMSKSTLFHISNNLKSFFFWLSHEKNYNKIKLTDIEYFNLLENDKAAAKVKRFKAFPTIEQIRKVIFSLPDATDIEKRNKALIAFIILTGARDAAVASLKIKHVDIYQGSITQDPNDGVKTKFGKLIYTKFFPVGDDIKQVVIDWVKYLREEKLYGENDPLFPRTRLAHNKDFSFKAQGLELISWRTTTQIREVFKNSFEKCGLPYFNPHSFRDTLSSIGKKTCTLEQYQAWSQNFGHSKMSTTLDDYGNISTHRQFELIDGIKNLNRGGCF